MKEGGVIMFVELEFETTEQYRTMIEMVKEFAKGIDYTTDDIHETITFKNIDYLDHNQTSYEIRTEQKFFNFYDSDFSWLTIKCK